METMISRNFFYFFPAEEVGEEAAVAAEVIAEEIEATEVAVVEVTVEVTMEAVVHLLRITEADPEGIIVQDLDHTLLVSDISRNFFSKYL